eukprot:5955456-Pleurochrysis_carterae.AAC.12
MLYEGCVASRQTHGRERGFVDTADESDASHRMLLSFLFCAEHDSGGLLCAISPFQAVFCSAAVAVRQRGKGYQRAELP